MFCSNCGKNIEGNFCSNCGTGVNGNRNNMNNNINPVIYTRNISNKSSNVALILVFLGLFGLAGLHRLYVGKFGSGLIYLLTMGFLGIGTVIDIALILMGQFTDNVGNPLS